MQKGLNDSAIIEKLSPGDRILARYAGEGMLNDDMRKELDLPSGEIAERIDSLLRTFFGSTITIDLRARYLFTKKWEEYSRTHSVTKSGDIVLKSVASHADSVAAQTTQPPVEYPPVFMPTDGTAQTLPQSSAFEPPRSEGIAPEDDSSALIGNLATSQLRLLEHLANGVPLREVHKSIGVMPSTPAQYLQVIKKKIGAHPEPGQLAAHLVALYKRWVADGSKRPARESTFPYPSNQKRAFAERPSVSAPRVVPETLTAPPQVANGHDARSQTEAVRPMPPQSAHSQPVSLSIQLHEPASIVGVPISIRLGTADAAERLAKHLAEGYVLEVVNEYLWPNAAEHITTLLLVKRTTKR